MDYSYIFRSAKIKKESLEAAGFKTTDENSVWSRAGLPDYCFFRCGFHIEEFFNSHHLLLDGRRHKYHCQSMHLQKYFHIQTELSVIQ